MGSSPPSTSRSGETQPSPPRAQRSSQLLPQQKCHGGVIWAEMPPRRSLHRPSHCPTSVSLLPCLRATLSSSAPAPAELQTLDSIAAQAFPAPSHARPEASRPLTPAGGPQAPSVLPPECSFHPPTTGLSLMACHQPLQSPPTGPWPLVLLPSAHAP